MSGRSFLGHQLTREDSPYEADPTHRLGGFDHLLGSCSSPPPNRAGGNMIGDFWSSRSPLLVSFLLHLMFWQPILEHFQTFDREPQTLKHRCLFWRGSDSSVNMWLPSLHVQFCTVLGFSRKDSDVLLAARADYSDLPLGGTEPESVTRAATLLGSLLSASHSLEISHHKCHYVGLFSSYKPDRGDHLLVLGQRVA